jgi:predicted Na+-dependent transporter
MGLKFSKFLLAIMSLHAYYAKIETFGLFLIMVVYFSYKWSQSKRARYLVWSLIALALGFFFDHTILVGLLPMLCLDYHVRDGKALGVHR